MLYKSKYNEFIQKVGTVQDETYEEFLLSKVQVQTHNDIHGAIWDVLYYRDTSSIDDDQCVTAVLPSIIYVAVDVHNNHGFVDENYNLDYVSRTESKVNKTIKVSSFDYGSDRYQRVETILEEDNLRAIYKYERTM